MTRRTRGDAVRLAVFIPACWLSLAASVTAQSPEVRRQRFIDLLLDREDRFAIDMLERQVRRTEARVERLTQLASARPGQSAAIARSLASARGRLETLREQAQSPDTPIRRALEAQLRSANAAISSLQARLERLIRRGTRRMSPREARAYQSSLAVLRSQIETAEQQRDFLERAAASPTSPAEVASSSLPGL